MQVPEHEDLTGSEHLLIVVENMALVRELAAANEPLQHQNVSNYLKEIS